METALCHIGAAYNSTELTFPDNSLRLLCRDPPISGIRRVNAAAFLLVLIRWSWKLRRVSVCIPRYLIDSLVLILHVPTEMTVFFLFPAC